MNCEAVNYTKMIFIETSCNPRHVRIRTALGIGLPRRGCNVVMAGFDWTLT